ncbi:MAG: hypothetical protein IT557_05930 [Alphaproteobacteria bacterium]|nr:hypothetical protein [Alphaproteobacteria bacterium]
MASAEEGGCPEYRLRLFLSVDLAGSTAFKIGQGQPWADAEQSPRAQRKWEQEIRHFYQEFPHLVRQQYARCLDGESDSALSDRYPHVWKTVGDEILFCCRLENPRHLSICIDAFLKALRSYGERLDKNGRHMDVKGAAWVAAFPTPNVTVSVGLDQSDTAQQFNEEFEKKADNNPRQFDFLGTGIDCGFRVATKAAADRFPLSVELAWLLAKVAFSEDRGWRFVYHGREILKGVLRDRPYPLVSIETERDDAQKQVRHYERELTRQSPYAPRALCDFLEHFMTAEKIDRPLLPFVKDSEPKDYAEFQGHWNGGATEVRERNQSEVDAGKEADSGNEVPEEVTQQAQVIANAPQDPADPEPST